MNTQIKMMLVIALFILTGAVVNQVFFVLTPLPESPEMARARAEIAVERAKADLTQRSIYLTFGVGVAVIGAGILICFGSFWLALVVIRKIERGYVPSNSTAIEVYHEK